MNLRRSPQSMRSGFTLLELVAVLVVIAIALAAVAPSLRHFGRGRQANDTATQIMILLRHGRAAAINEARPHRFNIDPETRRYFLTVQQDGGWVPLETSWGRSFELPAQVRIDWAGDEVSETRHVHLSPTGAIDEARIAVHTPNGGEYRVVCRAIDQSIELVTNPGAQP